MSDTNAETQSQEAVPAAQEGATPEAQQSLLAAQPATPVVDAETDWLPAKFRVTKEDGTLDEAASSRKLAESYRALESHKGPLPKAPETPEGYQLSVPEGMSEEAFRDWQADPLFKDFTKQAHEQGMSNEQLQMVVGKYLQIAPQLMQANAALTVEEASAELGKVWQTPEAMQKGIADSIRAINAFGGEGSDVAGSRSRLMEKYGTDPDFIAFTAAVAKELKEDQPVQGVQTSEMDVEALMKSEAYWKATHPDHTRVKAQVTEFMARKYGTARRR